MKVVGHFGGTAAQYLRLADEVSLEADGFDFEAVLLRASLEPVSALFSFHYVNAREHSACKPSAKTSFEKAG